MKKYSVNKHHTLSELNITPLLDLAFVLLVIFILTTAPPVNDMDITLPTASDNPKDAARKAYYVEINNEGKIKLNNEPMNEDQLLNKLVEFRKENPDLNVVVRADAGIEFQRVVNVLDVLISARVAKFGLATEPLRRAGM
jgi:biopolymer transport protein ExbD